MSSPLLETTFSRIDRLIQATDFFVTSWGDTDEALVVELEAAVGFSVPEDFRQFLLRYGNLNLGFVSIGGLGPIQGKPAASGLTEERREEWPALPRDCLVLGEENTDLLALRENGSVEWRTESSRELDVFQSYSSFTKFLEACVDRATEEARSMGHVSPDFS